VRDSPPFVLRVAFAVVNARHRARTWAYRARLRLAIASSRCICCRWPMLFAPWAPILHPEIPMHRRCWRRTQPPNL
jgi:hypothetical protein